MQPLFYELLVTNVLILVLGIGMENSTAIKEKRQNPFKE